MSDSILLKGVELMNKTMLKKTIKILKYVVDNHEWCSKPVHTCWCGATHATPCDLVPLCKGCQAYNEAVALLQELTDTGLDGGVDE